MGTSKIVDFAEAQTNPCRVFVNGDRAFFDPTDSDATIKSAIEALSTMSGHTVAVTNLIAQRKWQFDFSNTLSSFFAAKSSDLGFANPAAIDLTDGSHMTPGVSSFPTRASGSTLFFRYRSRLGPGHAIASLYDGAFNIAHIYPYYQELGVALLQCGSSYCEWTSPNDALWHTLGIRAPASADLSDLVIYVDGVAVSVSVIVDGAYDWGTISEFMVGDRNTYIGSALAFVGDVDQVLVFDSDIGDTAAKSLNDFSAPGSGCVLALKGDEGTGTTVGDWSTESGGSPTGPNGATSSGNWITDTTTTVITDGSGAASGGGSLLLKKKRFLQRAA
jgi:hypothetical protein